MGIFVLQCQVGKSETGSLKAVISVHDTHTGLFTLKCKMYLYINK